VLVETEGVTMSVIEAERTEPTETATRIPMSREEFYNLPEGPPFYEWCRGEAIEMNQPTLDHQWISGNINIILRQALATSGLKVLSAPDVDLPYSVRVPDLVVCKPWPSGAPRLTEPPIIAVEILSPSTRRTDLVNKPTEYADFGIQQYWIIDPKEPSITIQQNVDGNWFSTAVLTSDNPTTVIDILGHGTITLDLNQIVAN